MLEDLDNSDEDNEDENEDLMSHRRSLFQSIIETNKEEMLGDDILDGISDSSEEDIQARRSYLSLRDNSSLKEIQRFTTPKSRFKTNATIIDLVASLNMPTKNLPETSYWENRKSLTIPEKDQKRMSYQTLNLAEQIFESDISDHKGLPFCI